MPPPFRRPAVRVTMRSPHRRTVAECLFDLFAEVGVIDDDLSKLAAARALQVPDDQRLYRRRPAAAWAWSVSGRMRSPTAGGEDHRLHFITVKLQFAAAPTGGGKKSRKPLDVPIMATLLTQ